MTEPSGSQYELAAAVIGRIYSDGAGADVELDDQLVIADLEQAVVQFRWEMELLDELGLPAPALRVSDGPVPVSLVALTADPFLPYFIPPAFLPRPPLWRYEQELLATEYLMRDGLIQTGLEQTSLFDARESLVARHFDDTGFRLRSGVVGGRG